MSSPFRTHNDVVWDGDVVRCHTEPHHANVGGGIHGGLLAAMLDSAMGGAVIREAGRPAVTSSLTVNYLEAGSIGDDLEARAVVRRVGRPLAYVDGTCTRASDSLVLATATGVFALVGPQRA